MRELALLTQQNKNPLFKFQPKQIMCEEQMDHLIVDYENDFYEFIPAKEKN